MLSRIIIYKNTKFDNFMVYYLNRFPNKIIPEIASVNITKKEDVSILNQEIRHISSQTSFHPKDTYFFKSKTFWIGLVSSPTLFVATFLFLLFRPQKDEKKITQKSASRKALKILNEAKKHLDSKDDLLFYESLYKGLLQYLSNKFSVPTSTLTKESIKETLLQNKVEENSVNLFIKIVEECEMARFAPITHAGAENTMNQAVSIIQNIEKNAK
jgi:ribosomal protein S15P/S13E